MGDDYEVAAVSLRLNTIGGVVRLLIVGMKWANKYCHRPCSDTNLETLQHDGFRHLSQAIINTIMNYAIGGY